MLTIHKFAVPTIDTEIEIEMPVSTKILTVQNQREWMYIWALVNTEAPKEKCKFMIFGTGHEIPKGVHLEYIGTTQYDDGHFVWHLFKTR